MGQTDPSVLGRRRRVEGHMQRAYRAACGSRGHRAYRRVLHFEKKHQPLSSHWAGGAAALGVVGRGMMEQETWNERQGEPSEGAAGLHGCPLLSMR